MAPPKSVPAASDGARKRFDCAVRRRELGAFALTHLLLQFAIEEKRRNAVRQ
jgi:hypothetical protein